jgi:hypothetical protein
LGDGYMFDGVGVVEGWAGLRVGGGHMVFEFAMLLRITY